MEELIEALSISNNPQKKVIDSDLITIEDLLDFWNSNVVSERIKQELKEFLEEKNLFSSFSDGGFYKGIFQYGVSLYFSFYTFLFLQGGF
ncbi:hypothetical protein DSO57_1039254 [Entomophthora muscae]|uniref:Uncharacterized protein n=1 Tax=Entomophthora muscae TaxID=34485 RepID=A0ACC2TKI2_9FUNG|nr:hypothetical protein DSO57_1039254 [Entomophthora muscae]